MLKVFNNGDLNENENGYLIAASIRLLTTTIVTPRVLLKNANRNFPQTKSQLLIIPFADLRFARHA